MCLSINRKNREILNDKSQFNPKALPIHKLYTVFMTQCNVFYEARGTMKYLIPGQMGEQSNISYLANCGLPMFSNETRNNKILHTCDLVSQIFDTWPMEASQ